MLQEQDEGYRSRMQDAGVGCMIQEKDAGYGSRMQDTIAGC